MTNNASLSLARAARTAATETQVFTLCWRGGGTAQVVGQTTLAAALGITVKSLRVYLANGHGTFDCTRTNPVTGEPDMLTVTRAVQAKPVARRGRPPKLLNVDRLGTEFAPPAKTVPK